MTDQERFWSRVRQSDGCWEWTAARLALGYGIFVAGSTKNGTRKQWRAHRYAYETMVGPIPEGLVLDHLCRNECCVRPDHLEAVTQATNLARGVGASARNAAKTHCSKGHAYSGENLGTLGSRRYCKICNRAKVSYYKRLARDRRRAARA